MLAVLVLGFTSVLILVKESQLLKKRAVSYTASLAFSQTQFTGLNPGDPVNVNVVLTTGSSPAPEVVAVDAQIDFDKSVLELVSVDPSWAIANVNFKTFPPIVSQADCTSNIDVNQANAAGRVEFGAVAFDCQSGALTGSVSGVVNNLARLNFRVKAGASGSYPEAIKFGWSGEGASDDSNVILSPAGDVVEDILKQPTETVGLVLGGGPVSPTTPPGPSPTPPPAGVGQLTVKFRVQGITTTRPGQSFYLGVKKGGFLIGEASGVTASADANGVFTAVMDSGPFCNSGGSADVLIKSRSHLKKKFSGWTVACGDTSLDRSSQQMDELLVGDVNDSNTITVDDVSLVLAKYTDFSVPVAAGTPEDVNMDGVITINDVALVLYNYQDFEILGDE